MAGQANGTSTEDQLNAGVLAEDTDLPDSDNGNFSGALKEFGVDTDRMVEATNERVGDVQQMLIDEIRARPMRALGWAAAAGLFVGFLAAR
ncbi:MULTISPECIES: hypothetical protein [unclassified Bosea (in: a-proteobacteria)]|uniref:hypothetical protein n=1 Tax=unclassified Bosea (in: a-proteobacteria) TaxID=2653178 RepID=UPI000F763889|nr:MULTISPECIES: hypothetical protein [unclassified Bosea (in: a-proteobacteria)]AZO82044.1 hypothetical protein BLM15_30090 [Bosea sp. Tri-49]RXT24617.1 hypothetical protein B5U98_08205 [Bosea sp. Tri-39]RXT42452.1 hypothetical protein B5U99_00675 [Bosea sp. Tri-54]